MRETVRDLTNVDGLAGDLFALPQTAAEWAAHQLSAEQVAHFHEHGFVAGIQVLDDAQCDTLCAELADLTDPNYPGNHLFHEYNSNESADPARVLFHALGAWRIKPGFHDIVRHPAVTVAASQLLDGAAVRYWHDQLFCKPAQDGAVVAWHQDYSYWTRTEPMGHLTCWIGLDAADEDNGCVWYVPGSHRWPLLPTVGLAGDMEAIRSVLTPEQEAQFERRVSVPLKRGQATFHHARMLHGSYENRTTRPRRATVVNMFKDGTRSAADEPMQAGIPIVPRGETMDGPFFPLLFDPAWLGGA